MKKSRFATETDRILLECLANIQKSIRDYQRDMAESLEEVKFSLSLEND
jgi:hypothetical protein